MKPSHGEQGSYRDQLGLVVKCLVCEFTHWVRIHALSLMSCGTLDKLAQCLCLHDKLKILIIPTLGILRDQQMLSHLPYTDYNN